MTENKTITPEEKKAQEQSTIEKIRVLNSLLTSVVPLDQPDGYGQFREHTIYKLAFNQRQMVIIRNKIMELVKQL